jgi:acetyl-CoA synthetase
MCAQVRTFYTAPTLIRSLEAQDDKFVTAHDRSSLRLLGTVGEPINPRAWSWFFQARRPLPASVAQDWCQLLALHGWRPVLVLPSTMPCQLCG